MNKPPINNPKAGMNHPPDRSIAGRINDQKLAASMTPAPKPSKESSHFPSTFRKQYTVAAPNAVIAQLNSVANRLPETGSNSNIPITTPLLFMYSDHTMIFLKKVSKKC